MTTAQQTAQPRHLTPQELAALIKANLAEGTIAAISKLTALKPVPRAKAKKRDEPEPPVENFDDRPGDYRRAIQAARLAGTSVYAQLCDLGMARPFEELVALD